MIFHSRLLGSEHLSVWHFVTIGTSIVWIIIPSFLFSYAGIAAPILVGFDCFVADCDLLRFQVAAMCRLRHNSGAQTSAWASNPFLGIVRFCFRIEQVTFVLLRICSVFFQICLASSWLASAGICWSFSSRQHAWKSLLRKMAVLIGPLIFFAWGWD